MSTEKSEWCVIKGSGKRAHRACVNAFNNTIQCGMEDKTGCKDPECALHDAEQLARDRRYEVDQALRPIHIKLFRATAWPHPLGVGDSGADALILQFAEQIARQYPTLY